MAECLSVMMKKSFTTFTLVLIGYYFSASLIIQSQIKLEHLSVTMKNVL